MFVHFFAEEFNFSLLLCFYFFGSLWLCQKGIVRWVVSD